MRIEFYKAYNEIHTWTGIVAGLFLFICFLTGSLTMLKAPLNQWALQPQSSLPGIDRQDYDALIQQVYTEHPEAQAEMMVYLPHTFPQSAPVTWTVENPDTHEHTLWQASLNAGGDLITQQTAVSDVGEFFDHLHRTAGIPGGSGHDAIGTYFMGVVAAVYFVALVSGLVIFLPTWFKDFLTLRRGNNRKRYWLDFHNVLGISALPFHLVIALTTVVFAYHDIFYDSLQSWVYKETPMFDRPAPRPDMDASHLVSLNELENGIKQLEPEFTMAQVRLAGIGTPRAMAVVGGDLYGQWVRGPDYAYAVSDPYSGQPGYTAMLPSQSGFMGKVVNGLFTLHFGGFGGDTVKWIYVLLGISGSLLFFTGNIVWLETRRKKQKKNQQAVVQTKSSMVMARLTIGVCMGTLLGIVLTLMCVNWLPQQHYNIEIWQQVAYYSGFLLAIFWAFLTAPMTAAVWQLKLLCGLLVVLVGSTAWAGLSAVGSSLDVAFSVVAAVVLCTLLMVHKRLSARLPNIPRDSVWAPALPQIVDPPDAAAVVIQPQK